MDYEDEIINKCRRILELCMDVMNLWDRRDRHPRRLRTRRLVHMAHCIIDLLASATTNEEVERSRRAKVETIEV